MREEGGEVSAAQDPEGAAQEGQRADEHVERGHDAQGPQKGHPDPFHQRNSVDLHLRSFLTFSKTKELSEQY